MNFKQFGRTAQLFDASTAVIGKRVNAGGTETNADMAYSDYIDVQDISKLTVSHKPAITNFYFYEEKTPAASSYVNGYTADVPVNAKYCRINILASDVSVTMLNAGDTTLPYEPYGSAWHDVPHYIHNTSTDTITTLPAVLYPNAVTATVGLKGNMSQTGAPSPTTPIQPQETGERTENLFNINRQESTTFTTDEKYYIKGGVGNSTSVSPTVVTAAVSNNTLSVTASGTGNGVGYIIDVNPNTTYTISFDTDITLDNKTYAVMNTLTENLQMGTMISLYSKTKTITTSADTKYLYIVFRVVNNTCVYSNIMLKEGSTAPSSYIPYGYKIPILNNSQTTNVYLGEVESTRQIKQLMLTGNENISETTIGSKTIFQISQATVSDKKYGVATETMICSHYKVIDGRTNLETNDNAITTYNASNNNALLIRDDNCETLTDFTTYLTQQYSAGTPVTLWYVLATETTGIVNEPLMKIGTYADEVSDITIPTIAGANNFDVLTTLKPSEVTVNYKGWHPVSSVHERDNGAWT